MALSYLTVITTHLKMETFENTTRRMSKIIKDIWTSRRPETRVQVERKMGGGYSWSIYKLLL